MDVVWRPCLESACRYKTKQASDLKRHLANVHNKGVVYHLFEEVGCQYKAKQAWSLKRHLAIVHNRGGK